MHAASEAPTVNVAENVPAGVTLAVVESEPQVNVADAAPPSGSQLVPLTAIPTP